MRNRIRIRGLESLEFGVKKKTAYWWIRDAQNGQNDSSSPEMAESMGCGNWRWLGSVLRVSGCDVPVLLEALGDIIVHEPSGGRFPINSYRSTATPNVPWEV